MIGVYVFVDRDDRPLYVGASSDVASRVRSHRNTAPWWDDVADVWTFPTPHRAAAFEREARLIAEFQPLHNIRRKSGERGRRNPPMVKLAAVRRVYGDEFAARCAELDEQAADEVA